MTTAFAVELLSEAHERTTFRCGVPPLDDYFYARVTQDVRRRLTACYVAYEQSTRRLAGYYTLAASSVPLSELPPDITKKLPRYPLVPAVRLGRLAVDAQFRGQGLGGVLLVDAMMRALRADIAAYAIVVDAKDDLAVAFYRHHGFNIFVNDPRALFIPIASVSKLFSSGK